ncbi:MAG: Clp1/GlmU family protein [Armatimonadota bacterium]
MPLHLPDSWQSVIKSILEAPGLTVVLGNSDSGKTSFCLALTNAAADAGLSAAVVDGDTGQSEIGIPGVMGMGVTNSRLDSLKEIKPSAFYFVGATMPVNHLLATVTGLRVLVDKASEFKPGLTTVDTCGFVQGMIARRLNISMLEILHPKYIVAIQKSDELEQILHFFSTLTDTTIHRLSISPDAHIKTPMFRRQRRSIHFQEYFMQGKIHQVPLDSISLSSTWLGMGNPLEPKLLKFAETCLHTNVFYGELSVNGVYLVTAGDSDVKGAEPLQEHFRTRTVAIIPASRYIHLLVGLMDARHNLLACGIIQRIDFIARTVSIYSPIRTVVPVRAVSFGALKIRADGVELGQMRPGDL